MLFNEDQPLVSVSEARKILGKVAEEYSDDELRAYIYELDAIAKMIIRSDLVPKSL